MPSLIPSWQAKSRNFRGNGIILHFVRNYMAFMMATLPLIRGLGGDFCRYQPLRFWHREPPRESTKKSQLPEGTGTELHEQVEDNGNKNMEQGPRDQAH